jgi:hypothetical protein
MSNHVLSLWPARDDRDSAQAVARLATSATRPTTSNTLEICWLLMLVLCASVLLGINFADSYCVKSTGDARHRTFSAIAMLDVKNPRAFCKPRSMPYLCVLGTLMLFRAGTGVRWEAIA